MKLSDAIPNRRSVRNYTPRKVEKELVEQLLNAAVQAPSASNSQPWAFAVIQDEKLLKEYSDRAKQYLLTVIDRQPALEKYRAMLANPEFNIFYNAGTLIIIYSRPEGPSPQNDCALAAQNLMLAACGLGLGTCWIGFAKTLLDLPELKREAGVPPEYTAVAPIIVGYPQGRIPQLKKDPPQIIYWK